MTIQCAGNRTAMATLSKLLTNMPADRQPVAGAVAALAAVAAPGPGHGEAQSPSLTLGSTWMACPEIKVGISPKKSRLYCLGCERHLRREGRFHHKSSVYNSQLLWFAFQKLHCVTPVLRLPCSSVLTHVFQLVSSANAAEARTCNELAVLKVLSLQILLIH